MVLSILIPTYNRAEFLKRNLVQLASNIIYLKLTEKIEIIVSDNKSSDNTSVVLSEFNEEYSKELKIRVYTQDDNVGLQKNALFVLEKTESEFCMYLGDDDFVSKEYLSGVIDYISKKDNVSCVLPSFEQVDVNEDRLGYGRDLGLPNREFKSGFYNCLCNSWRGHQLSGVVFRVKGTLKAFSDQNINNIYPFIYFVAFNCLRGNVLRLTQYPIKVTQPGQENKDWGYGRDGLVNEVFDNYLKLFGNSLWKRNLLEMKFLSKQRFRYFQYLPKSFGNSSNSYRPFLIVVKEIAKAKNTSFFTSIVFPFVAIFLFLKLMVQKLIRKVYLFVIDNIGRSYCD